MTRKEERIPDSTPKLFKAHQNNTNNMIKSIILSITLAYASSFHIPTTKSLLRSSVSAFRDRSNVSLPSGEISIVF
jgi:hypothetical protein